jgi:hypothetical protein
MEDQAASPLTSYQEVLEVEGFELEPRPASQRLLYQAAHWPSLEASQFKVLLYLNGPQVLANLHHTAGPFGKTGETCFQGQQMQAPSDLAWLLQNATDLQHARAMAALPAPTPAHLQTTPGDAPGTTSCPPASGPHKCPPGCATGAAGAQ